VFFHYFWVTLYIAAPQRVSGRTLTILPECLAYSQNVSTILSLGLSAVRNNV